LPSVQVSASRSAVAGGEVQVVMVPARADQRVIAVTRGSRAAV